MKKALILLVVLFISTISHGQNLFFLGEKSYPCTEWFSFKSSTREYNLNILIAKDGRKGLFVVETRSFPSGLFIKGKLIIYLDNGTTISCIDRGIYDYVNETASTIYYLTPEEIVRMKENNINSIRYSLKCGNCMMDTREGDYTASNLTPDGYYEFSTRQKYTETDVPALIEELFPSLGNSASQLQLNLKKGEKYKLFSKSQMTTIQKIEGQKINIDIHTDYSLTFLVADINKDKYLMDVKYDKLATSFQTPQGLIEYKSDFKEVEDLNEISDISHLMSAMLNEIKNKPFKIIMNKKGEILEIRNLEKVFTTMMDPFGDLLSEAQKQQILSQMKQAYGKDNLKGSFEMNTAIYPDRPVSKGDKWTINTNLEAGYSARLNTIYKFTDSTSDFVYIEGNSTFESLNKNTYLNVNGSPTKYDLKGTMFSEIKIDKKSGWIIESNIIQEIKGDTYIKEDSQSSEEVKIPMTIITEMTTTS